MSVFADRLKRMREIRKMTQNELAEYVGVRQSTITKWEQGKFTPDVETLKEIARILRCSAGYLVGDTDDPTPPDDIAVKLKKVKSADEFSAIDLQELRTALLEREITWGDLPLDSADQESLRRIFIPIIDAMIRIKKTPK